VQSAEQYVRAWAAEVEGNPSLIQAVLGELSGHLELCNKPWSCATNRCFERPDQRRLSGSQITDDANREYGHPQIPAEPYTASTRSLAIALMTSTPDPAEELYAAYLKLVERGEAADFEEWVRQHTDLADELRRIHSEYSETGEGIGSPAGASNQKAGASFVLHRRGREQPQPAPGLAAGKEVGDFLLISMIGQGGMGQVWEAEQLSLGNRRVAIKFVRPERVTERQLELFQREARAGGRLSHPGIVAVFGYGEDSGVAWIAMELVEGTWTLRDFLDEVARLDEVPVGHDRSVANFVKETAEAMHAAHEANVIHRDLKPQNILITPDEHPKVTDFGLARITDEAGLSITGDFAGTYLYMSPEQVAAKRAGIDSRSDIFSLGVVLYELLGLRRPFEGDTTHQVAQQILWREAPDLHTLRSRIPRDLVVICGKALEKDPEKRYATMGEFAADIGRHLSNEPIHAKPPTSIERAVKWAQRNPTKSIGGAIASVALIVIAGLALNLSRTNSDLGVKTKELEFTNTSLETKTKELEFTNTSLETKTQELEFTNTSLETKTQELEESNTDLAVKTKEAEASAKAGQDNADAERKRAEEVLRLSLSQDYEDLMVLQAELWPPFPEKISALRTWLDDATKLSEQLPSLISKRDELRASAIPQTDEEQRLERESHPDYPHLMRLEGRLPMERAALNVRLGGEPAELPEFDEDEYPGTTAELLALAASYLDAGRQEFGREGLGVVLAERAVDLASDEEVAVCWATLARGLHLLGRDEDALATMGEAVASALGGEEATRYRQELVALEQAVRGARSEAGLKAADEAIAEWEATRDELRVRVEERQHWTFSEEAEAQSRTRWWHVQLSKLIVELEFLSEEGRGQLVLDGVSEEHGWSVARRLAFAEGLRGSYAEGGEYAARWEEALPRIRAAYPGLDLERQMGLVPIGFDLDSGLWEFWHVQSGEEPTRGDNGKLTMAEPSGLVFVLLPGGKFWMGAQSTRPDGQNFDKDADSNEGRVQEVELSAYFLSKYEMTQGQWKRIAGVNRSGYGPDGDWASNWSGDGSGGKLLQPVETVSWLDCQQSSERMGLNIPTEAQWEYGCRAGSSSVYSSGSEVLSLEGMANIADEYASNNGGSSNWAFEPGFEDGYTVHAPIGSLVPNAFGLHDVHGNVREWCRDFYLDYDTRPELGTGMRLGTSASRVLRGGSFNSTARYARSAFRFWYEPGSRGRDLGFRPSQDLSF
jgi:serine/threonine protein kinase/formylglycine-generating enzyme required for sulfatase activity